MRIGVVGINHKLADLRLREQLAKACQKWFGILQAQHGKHSFVLLSTCNRTEVYFSSYDLPDTHSYLLKFLRLEVEGEFDHKLYSYFGVDCFCHLTKVTLGLDSAILAETEIQGQVKLAYENTAEFHALPKEIHFLFQKSLGIAKQLRTQLQLGRGMPTLEDAIYQTAKTVFEVPQHARLLFIGASKINEKVLVYLKKKNFQNMTICNRSDHQTHVWSQLYGIEYLPWSHIFNWHTYDWMIFGTKSSDYLLKPNDLVNFSNRKLILDLCVPRNVDPALGLDPHITLYNIDQINYCLQNRSHDMVYNLAEAEQRVVQATQEHSKRYMEKMSHKIELLQITA